MQGHDSNKNETKRALTGELDTPDTHNLKPGHEVEDISTRSVYVALALLGAFIAVCFVVAFIISKEDSARMASENAIVSHYPKTEQEKLPANPRLQLLPGEPIHPLWQGLQYRDSVVAQLQSFGYIDQSKGIVHIPIELAKDIMLQRGFSVRPGGDTMGDGTIWVPSSSSAARTYMRRDQRIPGGTYTVTGGNMAVEGMPHPH